MSLFASITGLVTSVTLIVFMVLAIIGIFPLEGQGVNRYRVRFSALGYVLSDKVYDRGELIDTDFVIPVRPDDEEGKEYRFLGWDTNRDRIVNLIPMRAYMNIDAVAVYRAAKDPDRPSEEESIEESFEEVSYESQTYSL